MSAAAYARWERDLQDPAIRARTSAAGRRVNQHPSTFAPATNDRRRRAINDTVLGWCPPSLRDLNRRLQRRGFLLAERKKLIADHVEHAARREISNLQHAQRLRAEREKAQAY